MKTEANSILDVHGEGLTDIGMVRSSNQDALFVDNIKKVYIVADGMGGHAGGEIASAICIKEVPHLIDHHLQPLGAINQPDARVSVGVADAINGASTKIYERALEEPILKGMGTTATVLKIIDNYAYCGHVGDSRLYLVRCGYIYQITVDHSLVSDQLRAGLLTKEEAERHHLRNVITRSVGYQENEEVDTFVFPLENEDLLLLCSDGLHGRLNEQDLSNILSKDGINGLKTLIQLANDRGGDDNVTAIIVQAKSSP